MRRWWRDERGDGDVAAMLFIVPLAMGIVLLLVFVGRQGVAVEGVTHAAHVAAVAAARQRDPAAAQQAAVTAATATLTEAGTACAGGPEVGVSASEWAPGGVITVTITCTITTGDLAAIDAPQRTVSSSSSAVIDQFRGFQP
jgi:hypothetical protein